MNRFEFFSVKSYRPNIMACSLQSLFVLVTCLACLTPDHALAQNPYQLALSKDASVEKFPLSLPQFIDLVVERNQQLQTRDADLKIKEEGVEGALSIYEPVLVGSYKHLYNIEQNDAAQFASRGFQEIYEQKVEIYKLEVESLIPTGGQVTVGSSMNDTKDTLSDLNSQYRQLAYVNLVQPLLKNAGREATETQIRLAEGDVDLAMQSYRQEMLNLVGRASVVYWTISLAQQKLAMRKESVEVAKEILEDNRVRFKTGKMAEIEVLEAESGVALRKALENEAEKTFVEAQNDALTLFAAHAIAYDAVISAIDPLELDNGTYSYQDSVTMAFKYRPEYLATFMKLSQENIRLSYAKNQLWPELDLQASYGLNGLESDRSSAWDKMRDDDYYSWSVGLELRVPLFGDKKSASEVAQVKQRKRKALLEMKAIEVALANAVDTTIQNIQSATEQATYSGQVAGFNKRLLEIELVRLKAGKSNSRLVLEKEEDSRSAREAEVEALVAQKKALIELEMAEGSLLSRYSKDVM
jgi:outer membrane protein TolC